MGEFQKFAQSIKSQFKQIAKGNLYVVDISGDELWEAYLSAFPEGSNSQYKERTAHDCQSCRHFVRHIGNVVSIQNEQLKSVWDAKDLHYPYNEVAKTLAALIKSRLINNAFCSSEPEMGTAYNIQLLESGKTIRWNHLHCTVPFSYIESSTNKFHGNINTSMMVFKRGLDELSLEALNTVIQLIQRNNLYRGSEFLADIKTFKLFMVKYQTLNNPKDKNIFLWSKIKNRVARFRNSVLGTLVQDISNGMNLNMAVDVFESKVAPENYQRTSAVISEKMVTEAVKTIRELDIEASLKRRFAVTADLTINNVLFADRSISPLMKDSLTNLLMAETVSKKTFDQVDEIGIEDFIKNLLPNIKKLELKIGDNINNLVSLTAPTDENAAQIFKWPNNFGWSYNGNITDSVKERVKKAGGNVEAKLMVRLSWYNTDDLDIHVIEPDKNHVYYENKCGKLDVDMNVNVLVTDPVENVTWNNPLNGTYRVYVKNYKKRNSSNAGFTIHLVFNNQTHVYSYPQIVKNKEDIDVIEFTYNKHTDNLDIKVCEKINPNPLSQSIWGIKTESFHQVNMLMLSPNHWDDHIVGNKHWFFILENCINPDEARGIYNEFLINDLHQHRKVFEILGDKTKCPRSNEQLSGLGFSSTQTNTVIARIDNKRYLNIKF